MSAGLRIRSQVRVDREARQDGILDDCGPASAACAASWVTGREISAKEGIVAKAAATGREEIQGVSDNGSSLSELAKTVKVLGASARYPDSWDDAVGAARKGAALIINVSNGREPYYAGVKMSRWHRQLVKRNPAANGYGHMTAAAWDEELGWLWACPTMSGEGDEEYGVPVSEAQLRQIASSKGDAPKGRILIVKK
jgi:hypothetical protein